MSFGEYLVGSIELALVAAALGLGAWRLRALLLPGWSGAPARLAEVILGLAALVVVLELVGVVGLYRPGWVLGAAVAVGVGVAALSERAISRRSADPDRPGVAVLPSPAVTPIATAVAVGAALLVAAHWAIPTQEALEIGMYKPNTTWHNAPFAARFVQEAQVGALHFTEPLKLTVWYYPQNSELLHSSGVLFLGSDFLSPLINLGWMALCLLAACSFGRPYAAGALALLGVALLLDSDALLLYQPGDAKNDTAGLFFLLASAAILVNAEAQARAAAGSARTLHSGGPPLREVIPPAAIVVAGLAAGLALGTKLNLLAPVAALTLGVIAVAAAGSRIRTAVIWVGSMLVSGGFWFARNLIESGNPLPWIDPGPLPGPDQLEINIRQPGTVSDYLTDWTVIREWFIPGLHDSFGPVWPAVLGVLVLGFLLAIFRGETRVTRMLGVVAALSAVAYLFTPLTAAGPEGEPTGFVVNLRYLSPALGIGAMLLALDPALRSERRRSLALAALAILLLVTAIPSDVWEADRIGGAIVLALLVIAVPVGIALAAARGVPAPAVALAAVTTLGVAIAVGWPQSEDYIEDRYRVATAPADFPEGALDAMGFVRDQDLRDERIAVVGARVGYKQYVFYGEDLSNHVQYVGHHGPRGALTPIDSCEEWRRAINDGDYTYVIAGPAHLSQGRPPVEARWTGSDPAATQLLAADMTFVFRIDGELDPAGCARLGGGEVPQRQGQSPGPGAAL